MRLIKNYMKDDTLRQELNALTQATFCFDFEGWVKNGYFEGEYIPYSFEEDGKLLANVSANIMKFEQNGEIRNYIQLGTVMTDINHRNKGLARKLMELVIEEYKDSCDGIYLFGNLSALGFYRKLGFTEKLQYKYRLKEHCPVPARGRGFVKTDTNSIEVKRSYSDAVRSSISYGSFEQLNKYSLQMFYTSGLNNVYYSDELDCFIVMHTEENTLVVQSIVCNKYIPFERILGSVNLEYTALTLGFTPRKEDLHLFEAVPFDGGDDYRLFCMGDKLNSIEEERLFFPLLSHA